MQKRNLNDIYSLLSNLSVVNDNNRVITKWKNVEIANVKVSDRYEIFDFSEYLRSVIPNIDQNFEISDFSLKIKGGVQEIKLNSNIVPLCGESFVKCFWILNSTDKSRRLSISLGLKSLTSNKIFITKCNDFAFNKKHLKGLGEKVAENCNIIDTESFNKQIDSINSLANHSIKLSDLKKIVVFEDNQTNNLKFDNLKRAILYDSSLNLTNSQLMTLRTSSKNLIIDTNNDFSIPAMNVLWRWISLYNGKDSYILSKECDKIMEMTEFMVRNSNFDLLFS